MYDEYDWIRITSYLPSVSIICCLPSFCLYSDSFPCNLTWRRSPTVYIMWVFVPYCDVENWWSRSRKHEFTSPIERSETLRIRRIRRKSLSRVYRTSTIEYLWQTCWRSPCPWRRQQPHLKTRYQLDVLHVHTWLFGVEISCGVCIRF